MSWGAQETWFRDIAEETGSAPDTLLDKPELAPHLTQVWRDFFELSTNRHLGFGSVGPIPWIAINAYAERMGIVDPDEFERFTALIRAMDGEYQNCLAEKTKS